MLLAPVAREVLGDLRPRLSATSITMLGEPDGITLARDDGSDDGHARGSGEVGDSAVHLDVHLIERLLHPLHAASALFDEIRQLPLQGSEPHDRIAGPKGTAQQGAAVQEL